MNGILVVNKEENMTSFAVIRDLKRYFNMKRIGHAGTLDPMATGVLVVLLGDATKLSDYLLTNNKEYEAIINLGASTDTEDAEGNILEEKEVDVTEEQVDKVLSSLVGKIKQVPPMYSAIKKDGTPLYVLARKGEEVERDEREVEIFQIERTSKLIKENKRISFSFKCKVSKGTYIRTLCVEIGKRLNTLAYMERLNRVASGLFTIEESYKLSDIYNGNYKIINMVNAMKEYHQIEVDEYLEKKVKNGMKISFNDLNTKDEKIVFVKNDEIKAIYERSDVCYRAVRVWN